MFGKSKVVLQESQNQLVLENERLKEENASLQRKLEVLLQTETDTQKTLSENRLKTALVNTMLGGCGSSVKEIQQDIEQNLESSKEIVELSTSTVESIGTLNEISNNL